MLYERSCSAKGTTEALIGQWLDTKIAVLFHCGDRIPKELMGQSENIKQKMKIPKTFDICFFVIISCYDQSLTLLSFLRSFFFFFSCVGTEALQRQKCRAESFLRSFKSFGNSRFNSYTNFVILEIKSWFTCGELNLSKVLHYFIILFPR